jgi:peptidoglycan/xylan/chitin deacetylase (PgdA/CDA1 family)
MSRSLHLLARYGLDQVPNKRAFLARFFQAFGISRLLEHVAMSRWPFLVVMTYHRIAVPGISDNPYYDPIISATPAAFQMQLQLLRSRFHILKLADLLNEGMDVLALRCNKRPLALVTFDDGYRDNYDIALPILCKLGVPATFFITSGFLERPWLPWWDHVAYTIKQTRVRKFDLERWPGDPDPLHIDMAPHSRDSKCALAIRQVVNQFLDGAIRDESWFLAQMDQQAGVAIDPEAAGRKLFMSWQEVRQLTTAGMAIGSHGHGHRALAQLDDSAQAFELAHSQHLLERELGCKVRTCAFPFGWRGTFTHRTLELAARTGYQLAFSSIEGINDLRECRFDRFCVRRLNVGTGDSGPLLRARVALHAAVGSSFL